MTLTHLRHLPIRLPILFAGLALIVSSVASITYASDTSLRGRSLFPLHQVNNIHPGKVLLGEALFFDVRLSGDNSITCASCHDIDKGGADGLKKAIGINGAEGPINTPTVFNSVFNISQFWNGRAATLEEQAAGPVHNPSEMGSNWLDVVTKLSQDRDLDAQFKEIYDDGITGENIVNALAMFERTLVTYNAPFDNFLRGDKNAISDIAKHGYELFESYGCISCHQGANVGGNMYQTMGIMDDYFKERGNENAADQGRYDVTGHERDRYVFKVPSLRMVVHTAPYFHDGSAKTLKEAVNIMARFQLGRDLPEQDLIPIIAFLESLAGQYKRFSP
ncbi:MAG: cytochrome B6 [Rhodospirillaceae bacterium]|nr:MAG: cytochrome B6 [Rhodospirillaceae bacterium]